MKTPNILQFFIKKEEDGGYSAQAIGFSIYTQGETLDETVSNIQEAVECHFGEDEIKSHYVPITVNFALPQLV